MASTLTLVIQAELDGHPIVGSPFCFELELDKLITFATSVAGAGNSTSFTQLAELSGIATALQALLLSNPDAALNYRFPGMTVEYVPVPAGGLVLIIRPSATDDPTLTINNSGSGAAAVRGFGGGS